MTVRTQPLIDAPVETLTDTERRARILEAAALEIEVRGHCCFVVCHAGNGSVCLGGAVLFALGRFPTPGSQWFSDSDWAAIDVLLNDRSFVERANWSQFSDTHTPADVTFLLRWRAQELRDLEGAAS